MAAAEGLVRLELGRAKGTGARFKPKSGQKKMGVAGSTAREDCGWQRGKREAS